MIGGGTKVAPAQLHDLVAQKKVTFFDGRDRIEASIGRFQNAIVPDVANTREFVAELDSGRHDHLDGSPIVTYCTGGIRCEVLSSLMVNRGFGEVYQLERGIARCGEAYGDSRLWEGSLYVFDERMSVPFTPDPAVIGECSLCGMPTTRMENRGDLACRELFVVCDEHAAETACSRHLTTKA